MTPDDREFGELIGEVRAIGKQLVDMQASNTREHADVIQRIDEVRRDVAKKADGERVNNHAGRIDSLEKTRDEGSGAARLIKVGEGLLVVGILIATFVVGRFG